jgi:hypothetical protein
MWSPVSRWERSTSSVNGRSGPSRPPRRAGIHPDLPVDGFSHRNANTSVRTANRWRNRASFSSAVDARVTAEPPLPGLEGVSSGKSRPPRAATGSGRSRPSSPRSRSISARAAISSERTAANSASTSPSIEPTTAHSGTKRQPCHRCGWWNRSMSPNRDLRTYLYLFR